MHCLRGGVFYLFVVFPLETAASGLSTCKQCGTSSARTAVATGNNTGIVVGIDSIIIPAVYRPCEMTS